MKYLTRVTKKALHLSVTVLSTKVLIGDIIFNSARTGDGTAMLHGRPSRVHPRRPGQLVGSIKCSW